MDVVLKRSIYIIFVKIDTDCYFKHEFVNHYRYRLLPKAIYAA